jgi:hypothetical protein
MEFDRKGSRIKKNGNNNMYTPGSKSSKFKLGLRKLGSAIIGFIDGQVGNNPL